MACINFKNPDVQNLVNKLGGGQEGENVVRAMLEAIEASHPPVTNFNGRKMFSDLLPELAAKYPLDKAWDIYLKSFSPDYDGPKYPLSEEATIQGAEKYYSNTVDKLEGIPEEFKEEIAAKSIKAAIKDANARIRQISLKSKETSKPSGLNKLADALETASTEMVFAKYINYIVKSSYGMLKTVRAMQDKNLDEVNYQEFAGRVKRFLSLAKDMKNISQFFDNKANGNQAYLNTALGAIYGTVSKELSMGLANISKIESAFDAIVRDRVTSVIMKNSTKVETDWKIKLGKQWDEDNNPKKLKLTEAQKYDRNKFIEEQMSQHKRAIERDKLAYANRVMEAKPNEISTWDAWFTNPLSINDELTAIAVRMSMDSQFKTRKNTRDTVNEFKNTFDKFMAHVSSRKTQEDKYREMIEEQLELDTEGNVVFDSEGKPKVVKGSTSQYMVSRYYSQFYDQMHKLERERVENVNSGNAIKAKEAEDRLNKWLSENTVVNPLTSTYEPNAKWINPKYDMFDVEQSNDPIVEMYRALTEIQSRADSFLPYDNQKLVYRIPGIRKSVYERASSNGILDAGLDAMYSEFTIREDDIEFNEASQQRANDIERANKGLSNNDMARVPIYYRSTLAPKDLSYDLATGVLMNYYNSADHANRLDIQMDMEFLLQAAGNRKVWKPSNKVSRPYQQGDEDNPLIKVVTRAGKKISYLANDIKPGTESNDFKALKSFIGRNVYGIYSKDDPRMRKISQGLNKYTGRLLLSLNTASSFRNFLSGHLQSFIEAQGGTVYDKTNTRHGLSLYASDGNSTDVKDLFNLKGVIKQFGDLDRFTLKSKTNLLADYFQVESHWKLLENAYADDSVLKRWFNFKHLNFMNNMAEHHIQRTIMYSILDAKKVKTKDGKEISLHEAYKVEDGKLVVREDVIIPSGMEEDVSALIIHVLDRTQGNYRAELQPMAQNYALGSMIMLFRKFMPSGIKRRWRGLKMSDITNWDKVKWDEYEKEYYNSITEDYEVGDWTTTLRFAKGLTQDLVRLVYTLGNEDINISDNWKALDYKDKRAVIKTISEALIAGTALAAGSLLLGMSKDASDDDDKRRLAWLAYVTYALGLETTFYVNPFDTIKMLKNPTAVLNPIENLLGLLGALLPWDWDENTIDHIQTKLGNLGIGYRGATFDAVRTANMIIK